MNRSTIDFGIDLGTTNSAIAVLDNVQQFIIKNNEDQDVTPSAVYIDKNQQVHVGMRAKNIVSRKPQDAYTEFKRRMGTEYVYHFKASNQRRKPEELSSEVLKALRADVSRRLGEEVRTAVVTVPAAFELHQCDATKKAGELAGLQMCALLQEPVAAALAYGFQVDEEKAYWLVYDFGGGTFDAALIKAEDGLINVVHHGGNNFLGGADIDWEILEKIIGPTLANNYDLPDFTRSNARWEGEIRLLKNAVERAKIELTSKEKTTLDFEFEDESGTLIDGGEIVLTRAEVAKVAEPVISRSADMCLRVLAEKRLGSANIDKVILVGGPTKAPYFRDILAERLQIQIDASVDPLTVVAKGAAVFAGTQRVSARLQKSAQAGEFKIEMKNYSPIGIETEPDIGGKVVGYSAESTDGFGIEFVNEGSKWRSGRIPLLSNGVFMANLVAEKGSRNTFQIELTDAQGSRMKCVPDSLVYTVGAVVEEQPLIHSMGVELAGNEYDILAVKGAGLPLRTKTRIYRTIKALKAGEQGVAIRIPVVEGDNGTLADRNKLIGFFEITGETIKRDLPAGSEVEISFKIDADRVLTLVVFVQILDEEFVSAFDLRKKLIDPDAIFSDWESQKRRLKGLQTKAEQANASKAQAELEEIGQSNLFQEIVGSIKSAKADPDSAGKAEALLLEFKRKLDAIESDIELPALVAEFADWYGDTLKLTEQHGSDSQKSQAAELKEKADEAQRERNGDRLRMLLKKLQSLYYEILMSLPQFWVGQFQRLATRKAEMTDAAKAGRLLDMGQKYLTENNIDGLRNVVRQLYDLLPQTAVEEIKRGRVSDIML